MLLPQIYAHLLLKADVFQYAAYFQNLSRVPASEEELAPAMVEQPGRGRRDEDLTVQTLGVAAEQQPSGGCPAHYGKHHTCWLIPFAMNREEVYEKGSA